MEAGTRSRAVESNTHSDSPVGLRTEPKPPHRRRSHQCRVARRGWRRRTALCFVSGRLARRPALGKGPCVCVWTDADVSSWLPLPQRSSSFPRWLVQVAGVVVVLCIYVGVVWYRCEWRASNENRKSKRRRGEPAGKRWSNTRLQQQQHHQLARAENHASVYHLERPKRKAL